MSEAGPLHHGGDHRDNGYHDHQDDKPGNPQPLVLPRWGLSRLYCHYAAKTEAPVERSVLAPRSPYGEPGSSARLVRLLVQPTNGPNLVVAGGDDRHIPSHPALAVAEFGRLASDGD